MVNKKLRLYNDYVLKQSPYSFTMSDGGIYAISPFNANKDNKGLFKVGSTTSFIRRMEQYHTALAPVGTWLICFLRPKYNKSDGDRKTYFRKLEKILITKLINNKDVIPVKPKTRVVFPTEWFYTDISEIHKAFYEIADDYLDKSIKSNKLILNDFNYKICRDYELNEKKAKSNTGITLTNEQYIPIQRFDRIGKNDDIQVITEFINQKEKEKLEKRKTRGIKIDYKKYF